jgi:hypothetical protein
MIQFLGVGQGLEGYFLILKHPSGPEYQISIPETTYKIIQENLSTMNQGIKIKELGRK